MKSTVLKTALFTLVSTGITTSVTADTSRHHPDYPVRTSRYALGGSLINESVAAVGDYEVKDFSSIKGMTGFSDKALETHFKLYGGYVKNTNRLLHELDKLRSEGDLSSPYYGELKRRFGWEFNGMRLHELYFGNMGGGASLSEQSTLFRMLERDYGSFMKWKEDFRSTGAMRGIGWVILYQDKMTGRLINEWVNEHDVGHLAGAEPLLVMDVWEHAYMVDYNINRGEYMDAFLRNINWDVVVERFGG